ncbi:unnamed protein product, partial [Amoebophrya sp. A25]
VGEFADNESHERAGSRLTAILCVKSIRLQRVIDCKEEEVKSSCRHHRAQNLAGGRLQCRATCGRCWTQRTDRLTVQREINDPSRARYMGEALLRVAGGTPRSTST